MACGLPVVCGGRGGFLEHVVHGYNGFVFNNNAEAIRYVQDLASDKNLLECMGRNARHSMEVAHSASEINKMISILTDLPKNPSICTAHQYISILDNHIAAAIK